MARAKGIHAYKVFKLGKADAKKDDRNLKFAVLLKAAPALPSRMTSIPLIPAFRHLCSPTTLLATAYRRASSPDSAI